VWGADEDYQLHRKASERGDPPTLCELRRDRSKRFSGIAGFGKRNRRAGRWQRRPSLAEAKTSWP
jgi:hypothetical protein